MKIEHCISWSFVCAGAVLLLAAIGENSASGADRTRGGGANRVESPGIGAPGAGAGARGAGVTPGVGAGVPGAGAGARGAGVAPGVGVGSPGAGVLPRGYYATIPAGWTKVYYGGCWCACVNQLYYEPVYYQGTIVYVIVP
jgi:hypothetical protein